MAEQPKSPIREIVQPFIDLVHAPRALWGVNLAYVIEGMCYFGILTGCLHMYFNHYVGLNDQHAGWMVGAMSAGITIAMLFLGTIADRKGVRFALLAAFVVLFIGRVVISGAPIADSSNIRVPEDVTGRNNPILFLTDAEPVPASAQQDEATLAAPATAPSDEGSTTQPSSTPPPATEAVEDAAAPVPSPGFGSTAHWLAILGILLVAVGYGMYQPGAYAAVRQFTTAKTAAMGFAMLYALMNLGGWIPSLAPILRTNKVDFFFGWKLPGLGVGVLGMIWVYTGFTAVALVVTWLILSRRTVETAIATAKAERELEKKKAPAEEGDQGEKKAEPSGADSPNIQPVEQLKIPVHMWCSLFVAMIPVYFIPDAWGIRWRFIVWGLLIFGPGIIALLPGGIRGPIVRWFALHPLANGKFFFFIFCLIPVQTLFAHNWLTLPMYVARGYRETWPWISTNWELASNFNPLLVFILVPIVTAITRKAKVYNMMIYGTLIMAAPTFLLAIGPYWWTLLGFLVIMTLGESMWQPRFLQYAAEIAPEGRTGAYMGVAQFPWFLTKVIVPLYSGWALQNYCPEQGIHHSKSMWLVYAFIAMFSTVLLLLAKPWVGKDFKTKSD